MLLRESEKDEVNWQAPVDASVQAVDGKNKNQVSRFADEGNAGVTGGRKY